MKQGGWREIVASLEDVSRHKPPISASRVQNITRLAHKYSKYYKEICNEIEKFIIKGKHEYRLSGLYLLDSICKYKSSARDDYIHYFAERIHEVIKKVLKVAKDKEKESVKKVVRIWAENEIFPKPAMISTARVLKEMIDYVPPGIQLEEQPSISIQNLIPNLNNQQPSFYSQPMSMMNPSSMDSREIHQPPVQNFDPSALHKLLSSIQTNASMIQMQSSYMAQPQTGLGSHYQSTLTQTNSPWKENKSSEGELKDIPSVSDSIDILFDYDDDEIDPNRKQEILRLREEEMEKKRLDEERKEQQKIKEDIERVKENQRLQELQRQRELEEQQKKQEQAELEKERLRQEQESAPPQGPIFSSTLFVGNLSPSVSEPMLASKFEKFGTIKNIIYKKEKHMAFVVFEHRRDAEEAKSAVHNEVLQGREIKIGWAAPYGLRGEINRETGEYLGSTGGSSYQGFPPSQYHNNESSRIQVGDDDFHNRDPRKRKVDRMSTWDDDNNEYNNQRRR